MNVISNKSLKRYMKKYNNINNTMSSSTFKHCTKQNSSTLLRYQDGMNREKVLWMFIFIKASLAFFEYIPNNVWLLDDFYEEFERHNVTMNSLNESVFQPLQRQLQKNSEYLEHITTEILKNTPIELNDKLSNRACVLFDNYNDNETSIRIPIYFRPLLIHYIRITE